MTKVIRGCFRKDLTDEFGLNIVEWTCSFIVDTGMTVFGIQFVMVVALVVGTSTVALGSCASNAWHFGS